MDKRPNFHEYEKDIYSAWENAGAFTPEIDPDKEPYTIVLPPPNASGKMHTGNVLMIAIEDLLIRWKRMQGYSALWIPGTDHAGTETQITFERELKKEGKSRFDYSRKDLYQAIWDFVQNNKHNIEDQIREMGASVDWSRYTFTLDPQVVKTVHDTFRKMANDGLVYRGEYLVNYCTKCGTTYSDVELKHDERTDPLYYMKYGPFVLATVRPETKFGDTAVAVNPKDPRYTDWVGKEIGVTGLNGNFSLKVIADDFVDPEFGTGVVKVTPAHDKNDYEASLRHGLEIKSVIDLTGKLNDNAGKFSGLTVAEGRKQVVAALQEQGLMDHIDEKYSHTVALCKAGHEIEPMVLPNWFIKTDAPHKSFKKPALDAVKNGEVQIYPKWQEITYVRWMEEMYDWPISRQNVWGIQIPVWYDISDPEKIYVWFVDKTGEYHHGTLQSFLKDDVTLEEITDRLQRVLAQDDVPWVFEEDKDPGITYLPETDTFDTWFSSGQWPLVTLGYPDSEDFNYFYPTSVLETGWEIIRLWVSRMIMFGIYLTGKPPFKDVYLHGLVRAIDGRKMSKSLGNVINPDDYIKEYGVDALRMGLISGTANGKDFAFPHDKIVGYQRFGSKIWNMTRFMLLMKANYNGEIPAFDTLSSSQLSESDKQILTSLEQTIATVEENLEKYRFADAGEAIYQFMWHEVADIYIESVKSREDKNIALSVLVHILITGLTLLHPFMPFITEKLYQVLREEGILSDDQPTFIMLATWPKTNKTFLSKVSLAKHG